MALRNFIKAWLVYWALILLAPFGSAVPKPWLGISVQLVFVVSVIVGYVLLPVDFKYKRLEPDLPKPSRTYVRLFWFSIFLSLLGVFFLTFDRIVIQGISFSDGLAVAREKWRVSGEDRQGAISSIYSVLGYLLAPALYYSIINLSAYKSVHKGNRGFRWLLVIVIILWNSVITGGRSVAFLAMIIFIATELYHRNFFLSPRRQWRPFAIKKGRLSILVILVLLVGYSLYVFKARSEAGSLMVADYVNDALTGLQLRIYPWVNSALVYVPFAEVFYLMILFLGYLVHSYVVTTSIVVYPYENKSLVIFTGLGLILAKLGLIDTPNVDWFLSGTFPSLPGSLYLQGNLFLLIPFGLVLGFLTNTVTVLLYKYPNESILMFAYIVLTSILIVSPVLFVFDSMMFPFIIIQLCLFAFLLRYRFKLTA